MVQTVKLFTFGDFTFDAESRRVRHTAGTSAILTPELAAILHELALNKDNEVSKETLFKNLCDRRGKQPEPKIVDVQVFKLRTALNGIFVDGGNHIVTVWGKGYGLYEKPQPREKAFKKSKDSWEPGMGKRLASIHLKESTSK